MECAVQSFRVQQAFRLIAGANWLLLVQVNAGHLQTVDLRRQDVVSYTLTPAIQNWLNYQHSSQSKAVWRYCGSELRHKVREGPTPCDQRMRKRTDCVLHRKVTAAGNPGLEHPQTFASKLHNPEANYIICAGTQASSCITLKFTKTLCAGTQASDLASESFRSRVERVP